VAEGDAERFRSVLDEYKKAPGVTRDRLYVDTMQQVFSNVSKVMVDSRSGSNLLYLPLDKLMQQAGGAAAAAPTPQPTEVPAAAPAADARSRDGGRSRDREIR
jgi:modulator of FtsH protease HflK